jgi:hypothetical protein
MIPTGPAIAKHSLSLKPRIFSRHTAPPRAFTNGGTAAYGSSTSDCPGHQHGCPRPTETQAEFFLVDTDRDRLGRIRDIVVFSGED